MLSTVFAACPVSFWSNCFHSVVKVNCMIKRPCTSFATFAPLTHCLFVFQFYYDQSCMVTDPILKYLFSLHIFLLLPLSIYHCHSIIKVPVNRGVHVLVLDFTRVLQGLLPLARHVRRHTPDIVKVPRAPINIEVFKFPVRCRFLWTETQDIEYKRKLREDK